jgi:hypothetical protein
MGEVRLVLAERAARGDWTDDELVLQAGHVAVTVSRYAKRDAGMRWRLRQLVKAGRLRADGEVKGVLYYRAAQ